MPVCTNTIFRRGGRELLDLLTHCVFAFNPDVLFLYLVREYQLRPQATGAVAIYDVFCDTVAPARLSVTSLIPPKDLRLERTVTQFRLAIQAASGERPAAENDSDPVAAEAVADEPIRSVIPLPPRFLFDSIADQLASSDEAKIATLESYYDTKLTPKENLPSGELSNGQRAFVDHVWTPRIRPYLVSSGFWRMATVG